MKKNKLNKNVVLRKEPKFDETEDTFGTSGEIARSYSVDPDWDRLDDDVDLRVYL